MASTLRSVVPLWVTVAVLAGCLAEPAPADEEDMGAQSRQHRHVRSADYASRDVQTVVVLGTTNGAIDAGDA